MPPCTIGNKFCLSGFLFASILRSIHRSVLYIAYYIRGPTVVVFTTSSRAIMMSEPILFWIAIESYGLIFMMDLSYGFWKVTPYYVISQSLLKDTIWNPPESVSIFLFQFINRCNPPTCSKNSPPGL